jgi:serralysin
MSMATKIADLITLDGTFADWPTTDMVMTAANPATGYQIYGAFLNDATLGNTYVIGIDATASTDPVIGAGTIIYLNTDQNNTTGYSLSWAKVGAEYEVQFARDTAGVLQAYLYSVTSTGVTTLLNGGAPLNTGFSSNGESVELAIPQALLTPTGGTAPTSINFASLINNANGLPADLTNPEYIITDPAAVVPPTTIGNLITLDGTFADWPAADIITNPANSAAGYEIYGAFLNDATLGNTYVIGIDATVSTDPVIGPGATLYLNTDQNNATGYELSFAKVGAEYEVQFAYGSNAELQPFLYSVTSTGVATLLNGGAPLHAGFSSNGESVELAIPQALLTPAGGAAPTSINFAALNGTQGLPTDLAGSPEYTITDPATLLPRTATHRVAIVYSDTTAGLYFRSLGDAPGAPSTAYSDLFMVAQNQARMAGVSYDVIDESKLTNINNLIGYDAIIFPAMADVNTADLPAIMSTLTSAVYNYHISLITAGDFLTNDQTGAPLPSPYANMETLLGLARASGGNSGTVTVTANDVSNPIMSGYTAGQTIQTFSNEGYTAYQGVGGVTPDVLVNQNVSDPTLPGGSETIPGVVETTTGGTNMSRDAGVVAVRMDMDQSQFPADVTPIDPATGKPLPGIYDTLIPILQQWNQQYDFVGSYYINIGDNPGAEDPSTTNWSVSSIYYQDLLAMGSEIGNHSYTHLINPPITTFTAHTVGVTPAGSIQVTLDSVPSFYGITVGMVVTGLNIGANAQLPPVGGETGAVVNTIVTAVSGNTITLSYVPGGYGTLNDGVLGDIPAGTTLTFSVPAENTNFLETATGEANSATNNPFTYAYEFNQSKTVEQQNLGVTIYGAAVPGAAETFATDQNILPYYQSGTGYTGYLTGGWTGISSGYPSAIGYMSPSATDEGALYIAPNMTFDFTEIQYEGKTVAQAEADWAAQFTALTANAAGTPVVVLPVHDYGVAAWNTTTNSPTGSPYAPMTVTNPDGTVTVVNMYTDFIAHAYADNYEFLTLEELAARTEAQQKASINYTTVGNTITATVTPDPTAPDLGGMALDVVNGGTQVIQNVTGWYAYNTQELFLPKNGGSFTINLGTTQDAVTHIASLPMRGDLLSVTGDGLNLKFSMVGEGDVVVDLGQFGTNAPVVMGATVKSLTGGLMDLTLSGLGEHDVSIGLAPTEVVSTVTFSADTGLSGTDFVTKTAAQTITGTLSAPLAAGDVVKVSLDNGVTWLTATAAAAATTFSLAATLTGSSTLIVRVESSVGIFSKQYVHAYVLDTVPETPTNLALAAGSDNGLFSSDNVTNVTKPTVTGKGEAGGLITLYDGATLLGTGIVTATGDWSVADTVTLADGTHSITATEEDLAGNFGPASAPLSITIDTAAETPTTLALAVGSDSGLLSNDNVTKVTNPTVTGNGEAGGLITLYDGTTVLGTGIVTATGSWSIADTVTLADGIHNITATEEDLAGNVGPASAPLTITIDTLPPAPPLFTNLTETAGPTTTLYGAAEAGSTVSITNGTIPLGSKTVSSAGAWSWSFLTGSSKTVRILTATATDIAGNTSGTSGTAQIGTSGNDTFYSTASNDVFYGNGGHDTFVLSSLFGHDVIADFDPAGQGHDQIDFHGSPILTTFASVLSHATDVSGGVLITQDAGDTLMLNGVGKSSLSAANFSFV